MKQYGCRCRMCNRVISTSYIHIANNITTYSTCTRCKRDIKEIYNKE